VKKKLAVGETQDKPENYVMWTVMARSCAATEAFLRIVELHTVQASSTITNDRPITSLSKACQSDECCSSRAFNCFRGERDFRANLIMNPFNVEQGALRILAGPMSWNRLRFCSGGRSNCNGRCKITGQRL
jgi:hypothetical protein